MMKSFSGIIRIRYLILAGFHTWVREPSKNQFVCASGTSGESNVRIL